MGLAVIATHADGSCTPASGGCTVSLPLRPLSDLQRRDIAYLPQQSEIDRSLPITVFELAALDNVIQRLSNEFGEFETPGGKAKPEQDGGSK